MYTHAQRVDDPDVQALRKAAGLLLKALREKSGLSQREMAAKVDVDFYTFISLTEHGRSRVPPDKIEVWAKTLGVDPRVFTRAMMRYYDPVTYRLLFDGVSNNEDDEKALLAEQFA